MCSCTKTFVLFCCLPAVIWRQRDRLRTFDKSDLRSAAAWCYCTHYSSVFTLMKLHTNSSYAPTLPPPPPTQPTSADISQPFCQQVPRWWNASLFAELSTSTEWIYNNLTSHPVHFSPAVAAVLGDPCTAHAPKTFDLIKTEMGRCYLRNFSINGHWLDQILI